MAAHIKFDPITKSLLDTSNDDVVSRSQLLLEVWLIKPGCPYGTGLIVDPGNRASSTSVGALVLYLPDHPEYRAYLSKWKAGDLFQRTVVQMLSRESEEQVGYAFDV
jgi:hypothetical protein